MSRRIIDTDDINKKKLKLSVFICNMIIIVLCLTGILAMVLGHFFRLDLKMEINEDNVDEIAKLFGVEDMEFDSTELKDEPIEIPIYLQIKGTTIISCIWTDGEKIVETFVNEQIDVITTQMEPIFKVAAKVAIKTAIPEVKKELANQLKESMADKYGDKTDEEVIDALEEEYGFKEESINEALDNVVEELFAEEPDTEKVKNIINTAIDDNTKKAVESGIVAQEDIDKIKTDVGENFDKVLEELSDENGKFDPYILLNKAMDGELGSLMEGIGGETITSKTPVAFERVAEATESEAQKEFKEKLTAKVNEALGENTDIINIVFSALGGLWLLSIVCFGIVLLVTLLKTFFAVNKTVSVFLACFFNFPGHLLIAGLNIAAMNLPKIMELVGASEMNAILSGLTVTFSSINWVATLCAFIMMGGWFYYRLLKKQVKALKREGELTKSIFEKEDYNPFEATPNFVGATVKESSGSTKTVENGSYTKKNGITYYNLYGTKDYDDMDFEETKTQSPIDR